LSDVLTYQKNALAAEIQRLREDNELAINALNVSHELTVQSLNERFESQLASQSAAGLLCWTNYYLCQGGYVFNGICLFVSK